MTRKKQKKELSNPVSTGGGGPRFENQVQTLFVVLMLTEGIVPCLTRPLLIKKIKLQGRYDGYNTDDFIAFVEEANGEEKTKLLAQIKLSINITQNDPVFADVIQAAWSDFNDENLFDKETDVFALITGPLTATDNEARTIYTHQTPLNLCHAVDTLTNTKLGKVMRFPRKKRERSTKQIAPSSRHREVDPLSDQNVEGVNLRTLAT